MPTDQQLRARLYGLFLDELDDQVGHLDRGLDTLASSLPEVPAGVIDELFRAAHSLKGAAQAVGVSGVSTHCHHLEDALAKVRDGALPVDEALLGKWAVTVDLIRDLGALLRQDESASTPAVSGEPATAAGTDGATTRQASSESKGLRRQGREQARTGGAEGGTVRVEQQKFDALIAQAGDLVTSSYAAEALVKHSVAASERVAREADLWGQSHEELARRLVVAGPGARDLQETLDRIGLRFRETSRELEQLARSAADHQRSLRVLAADFSESVRRARTVPFADAASGLPRLVRDLATEMSKRARLVVNAADGEIDKELAVRLHDVLRHLVRNAVDHGLESPAERSAAGKAVVGSIEITAALRSGGLEVQVRDDGRGVDRARVRQAARDLGLGQDDDDESVEALFRPGLSTAPSVGAVSGRGVGLDAVRATVEDAGGTVTLHSEPGAGTTVTMSIPLSSSTLRALLVLGGGEIVAVPSSPVQAVVRVPVDNPRVEGREVMRLGERTVPVVGLAGVLGWAEPEPVEGPRRDRRGLLITGAEGSVVLTVADLVSEQEIVLQPPPGRLTAMSALLGTTRTADGSVALVLNPSACVRAALSGPSEAQRAEAAPDEAVAPPRILLVEDTLITRELERSILETAGYAVTVAVDGQQAWRILQSGTFDVVVSDVNMPRMDGIALCRAIRASREHTGTRVLLVTSLHSDTDRRRGLDAGADAYLTKEGFDREELLSTVARLL
jgi:two-component system chemotaxis sensor kinase CheA